MTNQPFSNAFLYFPSTVALDVQQVVFLLKNKNIDNANSVLQGYSCNQLFLFLNSCVICYKVFQMVYFWARAIGLPMLWHILLGIEYVCHEIMKSVCAIAERYTVKFSVLLPFCKSCNVGTGFLYPPLKLCSLRQRYDSNSEYCQLRDHFRKFPQSLFLSFTR